MLTGSEQDDLGFEHHITKNEQVLIKRDGTIVTILRGKQAHSFMAKIDQLRFVEQQQWMARLTGNYKRGNEKKSKNHHRNR